MAGSHNLVHQNRRVNNYILQFRYYQHSRFRHSGMVDLHMVTLKLFVTIYRYKLNPSLISIQFSKGIPFTKTLFQLEIEIKVFKFNYLIFYPPPLLRLKHVSTDIFLQHLDHFSVLMVGIII